MDFDLLAYFLFMEEQEEKEKETDCTSDDEEVQNS